MVDNWVGLAQWIISNPEKLALGLVVVTGAWRWIREIWHETKEGAAHETFTDSLLRERGELMRENKELRAELRELRKKNGNGT